MKRPPSTALIFVLTVLLLAAAALAGGGLDTLRETLAGQPLSGAPDEYTRQAAAASPAPEPVPAPASRPSNLVFDTERLQAARDALEAMPALQGKSLRIYGGINVYGDGRINLDLIDPDVAGNVDSYHFADGAWRKGEPVNLHRMGSLFNLQDNSAALDDIDFTAVARVAKALQEQRETVMATPEKVDYVYLVIRSNARLSWRPDEVHGDRRSIILTFDKAGTLLKVAEKN